MGEIGSQDEPSSEPSGHRPGPLAMPRTPWRALWHERGAAFRVWLRFAAALGVLMAGAILARPFTDGPLTEWIASASAAVLRLLGVEATVAGDTVQSSLGPMTIIRECTAVYPTAIFAAAVLAYPSPMRRRLLGIGLGVVGIQLVNMVRLLSLLYIAGRHPDVFEMAHLVVWPSLIVLCTILFWIAWVSELAGNTKQ